MQAEDNASALFSKIFVQGDHAAVVRQLHRREERGSILDTLMEETRQFSQRLGRDDRLRLDQYFTSVRELEDPLRAAREWEQRGDTDGFAAELT